MFFILAGPFYSKPVNVTGSEVNNSTTLRAKRSLRGVCSNTDRKSAFSIQTLWARWIDFSFLLSKTVLNSSVTLLSTSLPPYLTCVLSSKHHSTSTTLLHQPQVTQAILLVLFISHLAPHVFIERDGAASITLLLSTTLESVGLAFLDSLRVDYKASKQKQNRWRARGLSNLHIWVICKI